MPTGEGHIDPSGNVAHPPVRVRPQARPPGSREVKASRVSRATRAQFARQAAQIRADHQRRGTPVPAIYDQITRDLPITPPGGLAVRLRVVAPPCGRGRGAGVSIRWAGRARAEHSDAVPVGTRPGPSWPGLPPRPGPGVRHRPDTAGCSPAQGRTRLVRSADTAAATGAPDAPRVPRADRRRRQHQPARHGRAGLFGLGQRGARALAHLRAGLVQGPANGPRLPHPRRRPIGERQRRVTRNDYYWDRPPARVQVPYGELQPA